MPELARYKHVALCAKGGTAYIARRLSSKRAQPPVSLTKDGKADPPGGKEKKSGRTAYLLNLATNLSFIDQALVSGSNLTAGILMARTFGIYEFGRFTLIWMAVEFLMSLQFSTVIQPMLNIGPKHAESRLDRYFSAVFTQQLVFCLVMGGGAWLTVAAADALFNDVTVSELGPAIFAAIVTYQLHSFFRRYLFVRDRPFLALLLDMLRFGIQLPVMFALLFVLQQGPEASSGLWIIAAACGISTSFGVYHFGQFRWDRSIFLQVTARHWEFSKWLLPSALMHWMTSQAYVLISGIVLGTVATGSLRAAMGITGVLNILVQALDSFAPAQASRAFQQGGRAQLNRYILRLGALMSVLSLATVFILNMAPELAVRLLYGEQYEGIGYLVKWLCIPAIVYCAAVILTICVAAMERTRLIFRSYVAATICSLLTAYPLAHFAGIVGVVAAWFVIECVRVAMLLIGLFRQKGHDLEGRPYRPVSQTGQPSDAASDGSETIRWRDQHRTKPEADPLRLRSNAHFFPLLQWRSSERS